MTDKEAIEIVARRMVHAVLIEAADWDGIDWGDYPDLGEYDFGAALAKVEEIAVTYHVTDDRFGVAYDFLAERTGERNE